MSPSINQSSPRRGRPRDPEIDSAVLDATAELLSEVGYGRLSLEAIARRAGTTKPALYRRWPARQHLVLDTVAARLGPIELPATPCVICALTEVIERSIGAFERVPDGVLVALLADCVADRALYERCGALVLEPPHQALEQVLRAAVARGELRAELDLATAVDLLGLHVAGAVLQASPPRGDAAERAASLLLQGMARDYASLAGHCHRERGAERLASDG